MILSPRLAKAYFAVFIVLLMAGAGSFCVGCWRAIHAPYELDYGEGAVLWQAQQVTHLDQAYHNIAHLPYMVFHYPPLYHLVARGFESLTGDLLAAGRLTSFLSALAVSVLLGLFVWFSIPQRFPGFLRLGAAASGALLSLNLPTMAWAELMRVDLLGLFLTFAGLLLFLLAPRTSGLDYAAFLCFALAVFTKQTDVAAPAACLAIALVVDRSRALRLGGFMLLLMGAGIVGLVAATHGDVLRNLLLYNVNPFSIVNMLGIVQLQLAATLPLGAIGLAIPIMGLARIDRLPSTTRFSTVRHWLVANQSRRGIALASVHMLIALAISFTAGKRGSNYNYFLEWNLACCVLFSLTLAFVLKRHKALTADLGVLIIALMLGTNGVAAFAGRFRATGSSSRVQVSNQVISFLHSVDGPVYSEDLTLLLRSGKEAFAEPSIITALAQRGGWDQSAFLARIRSGFFKAVIVTTSLDNNNRYTAEVQAAINDAYRIDRNFENYKIYVARSGKIKD